MQKYNLKEYSGNPIDFPEFISNYYLTLAAYNVADPEKIQKLVLCLKGNARDQYMELFNVNPAPVFVNWAAFKVAFERRIFPEGTQRLFRRAFYERTQKRGESIQEFTSALSTMAERAFEIINHPPELPQQPARVRRPPRAHPPGVNVRHTRPTINDETRETLAKRAQYTLARQRAIHIDNENDEVTNIVINGLNRNLKITLNKSAQYDLSELIQKIKQQTPITTRTFDESDCQMVVEMLRENTSKGSCIIALQICFQRSLNEYILGKMDKRQLILYSTSRVKTLVHHLSNKYEVGRFWQLRNEHRRKRSITPCLEKQTGNDHDQRKQTRNSLQPL